MKMIKILLEVFSFIVQFFLCCIIISIALPFIVLKVGGELFIESLENNSFIKRLKKIRE
jgi:hypothetical protein